MLTHLYIRDFAIVHELELELGPGLTVLTGETGAGKSIVIDALALALGERAESHVIRHRRQRAEVVASFRLLPTHDAARWLAEHELFDESECVLRRVLEIDKPSRGFINGRPMPIQMLRELGELLVDVHGQHEHQSLLRRDAQRQILDDYAGLPESVDALGARYHEFRALHERLENLRRESADRDARLELLRYQVRELETLGLAPDEIPQLEEEHARQANAAELLEGTQSVAHMVYDDDEHAVARLLALAVNRLEALRRYDPKLAEVRTLLDEAVIQIDEAAGRLHQYLDSLEIDPERLRLLDARLATIHDLSRKHRVEANQLPALLERLRAELSDLENLDTNLATLDQAARAAHGACLLLARQISDKRAAAAKKLAAAVTARMQELGMPGGRFEVNLTPLSDSELGPHGLDHIEFLVSANPGQPPRALTKVASGGELSRISLALQVVVASLGRIPTLIFDEVDVGIGGRVAEIVGQQLRALGTSRQVLCITHLAQVAALGDRHLQVAKRIQGKETLTEVHPLSDAERVHEIARMIGGIEISKQTLAHAQDMLARASG